MQPVTNVYLYENGEKFFGEGPYRLLKGVERTGSLRAAAMEMNMSYSKATGLIRRAEKILSFPLTEKRIGGVGGGGSQLTAEAKIFLKKYEMYREACYESNKTIYQEIFHSPKEKIGDHTEDAVRIGCILMASGLSVRFGSNKLLEYVDGKMLIDRILDTTDGDLFAKRVVVTRSEEVAEICREKGVDVILHTCPNRNDTVRLGTEYLKDMDGWVFCPCDQPLLKKESLINLLNVPYLHEDLIARLHWKETEGTPIFFGKNYFEELRNLPDKKGGSYIVKQYPEKVKLVSVQDEKELWDLDTKEDLHLFD